MCGNIILTSNGCWPLYLAQGQFEAMTKNFFQKINLKVVAAFHDTEIFAYRKNASNYTSVVFRPYFSECVNGRYCQCKPNVEGVSCDRCRQGTFGLQESNPLGCTQCWCSGVANDCSVATMYWSTLRLPFFDDNHEVRLSER